MNPRKQSSHSFPRIDATEFFDNLKPPSQEEMPHNLFGNSSSHQLKPEYLQMPIKLQEDQISRDNIYLRGHSLGRSSSVSQQNEDQLQDLLIQSGPFSYKPYQQDLHEHLLMNASGKMEMIDEILIPHDQIREIYPQQQSLSQIALESLEGRHSNLKIEEGGEVTGNDVHKRRQRLQQQKKDLQVLLNTLRLFNQTMLVAMNFHRLYKKDTLSKYFNTIYNVVLKETRRIDAFIAEEQKQIEESLRRLSVCDNNIKMEWEEVSVGSSANKDLFSTMIEDGYKQKEKKRD